MKRKTAGFYDPYLDVLGGGEKYVLSILKALNDEYDITIFWEKNLEADINEKFAIKFHNLKFESDGLFKSKSSAIGKLLLLRKFDVFFYISDGSYFFSSAGKNFIHSMVPDPALYKQTTLNKLKLLNWRFISNSFFTQGFLNRFGVKSEVLYPYLDDNFVKEAVYKKEKIILSVGRFFSHLHSKKQDLMIRVFKDLKKNYPEKFKGFKLILAGGLKKADKGFYNTLVNLINNDRAIILKPNLSYEELLELYKKSLIYWHFAGYGVDDDKHPELVEHLGITPLEAMASGCLTFCVNAGGPKELIESGKTGFLFDTVDQLNKQMLEIIEDEKLGNKITNRAEEFAREKFAYRIFKKNVSAITEK